MSIHWKKKAIASTVAIVLFLFTAVVGSADIVTTKNINADIDNLADLTSTINIAQDETISGISISLNGIEHGWVGDLVVTLEGPQSQSITIFDRVGEGMFGADSNLAAEFPDGGVQAYQFSDSSSSNFWEAATSGDTNFDIIAGNYRSSDNQGTDTSMNAAVAGSSTQGNWTLRITDGAGGDSGNIVSWTVSFSSTATSVPEPSSAILLAGLSLFMLRRHRSV